MELLFVVSVLSPPKILSHAVVKMMIVAVTLMFGGLKIAKTGRSERTKTLQRAEIIEWNHQSNFQTT